MEKAMYWGFCAHRDDNRHYFRVTFVWAKVTPIWRKLILKCNILKWWTIHSVEVVWYPDRQNTEQIVFACDLTNKMANIREVSLELVQSHYRFIFPWLNSILPFCSISHSRLRNTMHSNKQKQTVQHLASVLEICVHVCGKIIIGWKCFFCLNYINGCLRGRHIHFALSACICRMVCVCVFSTVCVLVWWR